MKIRNIVEILQDIIKYNIDTDLVYKIDNFNNSFSELKKILQSYNVTPEESGIIYSKIFSMLLNTLVARDEILVQIVSNELKKSYDKDFHLDFSKKKLKAFTDKILAVLEEEQQQTQTQINPNDSSAMDELRKEYQESQKQEESKQEMQTQQDDNARRQK